MNVLRPHFSPEEIDEILSTMRKSFEKGWIGNGPLVKEFEERWANFTKAKYAVAVNSCTSALDIAVRIADLPDTVTVSPFTFISSALAPLNAGYNVKFVDIDPVSLCTPRADIQVMYAGNQDGEGIIYDMAHSAGEKHKGEISCWSFHAVKNLPVGDGGMITMNDPELYRRAKAISWCGIDRSTWERSDSKKYAWDYDITEVGLKAHMNDLFAAIGLVKLRHLVTENYFRSYLATLYDTHLPDYIQRPFRSSTWHLYTIRVKPGLRNGLLEYLAANDIHCGVHYKPLTEYTSVFGHDHDELPNTYQAYSEIISLPLHLGLTRKDILKVCDTIKNFFGNED